jgi:phage terminase small subunit
MAKGKQETKPGNDGLSLSERERRFVQEYIIDLNMTRAAVAAGYSDKAPTSVAYKVMQKPAVQKAIQNAIKDREDRTKVTADKVVKELALIAFVDIRKIFSDDGSLKDISEIDEDTARAIAGIDVEELWEGHGSDREHTGNLHKVRMNDKLKALELLGRHLNIFAAEGKNPFGDKKPTLIKIEYAE